MKKPSEARVRIVPSKLKTASTFRNAINDAIQLGETRLANRNACPNARCRRPAALASIVFRGIRVGKLCRYCFHVEMLASNS